MTFAGVEIGVLSQLRGVGRSMHPNPIAKFATVPPVAMVLRLDGVVNGQVLELDYVRLAPRPLQAP